MAFDVEQFRRNREALQAALGTWEGRTFTLRAFYGDTFRVSPEKSYVRDNGEPVLVIQVRRVDSGTDGYPWRWYDFSKASPRELEQNAAWIYDASGRVVIRKSEID